MLHSSDSGTPPAVLIGAFISKNIFFQEFFFKKLAKYKENVCISCAPEVHDSTCEVQVWSVSQIHLVPFTSLSTSLTTVFCSFISRADS